MAWSKKIVGSLIFNQNDGIIQHKRTAENLAKYIVKIAIPIHLLAKSTTVAIDSTGVKEECGHFTLPAELLKHITEAYLEAYADDPTATDAEVKVELVDVATATAIASVTFAGEGGDKKTSNIASTLADYSEKIIAGSINVTTASATSGATQTFRSIVLVLEIDLT